MRTTSRSFFGAVAAFILVPATALAQDTFEEDPSVFDEPADRAESDPPAAAPPPPPAPMSTTATVDDDTEVNPPTEENSRWYDDLSVGLFVDSFYQRDWNNPTNPLATGDVLHRAFEYTSGFAIAFAGLDLDYQTEKFGATLNLRFGGGTPRFLIGQPPAAELALEHVKEAYASWRPVEGLQLDFGQFGTIYGAEVAESWQNINYTRGALFYLMQPFYHTGLRAAYTVNDQLTITGLVANGVNNHTYIEENKAPDVGLQVALAPTDDTLIALGYLLSIYGPDSDQISHFFDLVATAELAPLTLVLNADLGMVPDAATDDSFLFYGVSLAAGLAITDWFGLGLRGEYLSDPDGFFYGIDAGLDLVTGTFTLDFKPIPGRDNLVVRLDNRVEYATSAIFPNGGEDEFDDLWFSTVLGVVVKTN